MAQVAMIFGAMLLLILARLLPHVANFTPVMALVLLASLTFRRSGVALILSLGSILISDFFLGFYEGIEWVYLAYFLSIAFTVLLKPLQRNIWVKGALAGLSGNIIFFIVSNFGVWMQGQFYSKTFEGLVSCYVAAIPFFVQSLLSTMIYGALLVVIGQAVVKAKPAVKPLWVKAT